MGIFGFEAGAFVGMFLRLKRIVGQVA